MNNSISENCSSCGLCAKDCSLLSESADSPAAIAQRGATVHEAYSCTLCDLCSAVCPQGISPMEMFAARRREAVTNSEIDINEYRYMFPDRKNNVMNIYRHQFGVDYSDINSFKEIESCFFPGCTLMTYAPVLTREIYKRLELSGDCQGMWMECCGKPLEQLGLQQRLTDMSGQLKIFVKEHNIKRLITACPGCYYQLRKLFDGTDLKIQTVYEVLKFVQQTQPASAICTVHDSCPDRHQGLFGSQVRQALDQCGYSMIEMAHNRDRTICCGSGGQQSHFRPDLAEELLLKRKREVQQSGADTLVGYCLSCVLKYEGKLTGINVVHALNLLLDLEPDFKGAKDRAAKMLSGPDGKRLWAEIMTED